MTGRLQSRQQGDDAPAPAAQPIGLDQLASGSSTESACDPETKGTNRTRERAAPLISGTAAFRSTIDISPGQASERPARWRRGRWACAGSPTCPRRWWRSWTTGQFPQGRALWTAVISARNQHRPSEGWRVWDGARACIRWSGRRGLVCARFWRSCRERGHAGEGYAHPPRLPVHRPRVRLTHRPLDRWYTRPANDHEHAPIRAAS